MALFPIAKIKAHSLTGRITSTLLLAAFKAVKRNRGAAGIDRVSLKMFEANLADNLPALERDLKSGSFQPLPLRRKFLDKGGGKFRPLGIPAVRDRVAQEVLRRLASNILRLTRSMPAAPRLRLTALKAACNSAKVILPVRE